MTNLPLVMPSNLGPMARELEKEHPGRMGLLLSPGGWCHPKGLPYALDNARFPVWSKGLTWNKKDFTKHLNKAKQTGYDPLWVTVPDTVADKKQTFLDWKEWAAALQGEYGWQLAFVVQDGMTTEEVKRVEPTPDIIFVGGSTQFKWRSVARWCKDFPRVHVGRVNTERLLWVAHRSGAESSDGTGWFHHKQYKQLVRYLERSGKGLGERDTPGIYY